MFPACPAELLLTLHLKTGRLAILRESVQVRSVMFMTGQFALKYGRLVFTACLKVESRKFFKTRR